MPSTDSSDPTKDSPEEPKIVENENNEEIVKKVEEIEINKNDNNLSDAQEENQSKEPELAKACDKTGNKIEAINEKFCVRIDYTDR